MAIDARPAPVAPSLWLRILLAPVAGAVVLLGIWITGGVVTSDFRSGSFGAVRLASP